MSYIDRPLYVVDRSHGRGKPLPFDWVVEYASDGTLTGVWGARPPSETDAASDVRLMLTILQWLDPTDRFLAACRAAIATAVYPEEANKAYARLCKEPWGTFWLVVFNQAVVPKHGADAYAVLDAIASAVSAPTVAEITEAITGSP